MLWLFAVIVVLAFGAVVFVGAPYLPTLKNQVDIALDLADLRPGETLLELGCGDGRVLVAAAERGWRAVGIEINPFLAIIAWARTRRYGNLVTVRLGSFWNLRWPKSEAVFVFLVPRFMGQLDKKMRQYGGRLVSVAFVIPDKTPVKTRDSVYCYDYGKKKD